MKTKKIILIGVIISVIVIIITYLILKKASLKNKNPKKILIVGDSQSAIKTADGANVTFTYPNILKKTLEPQGYTIDVLALGGMSTDWMLKNLPAQLQKKKYDRVYIYGGGNDSSNSSISLENQTIPNIQKMVDMSNNSGADVFVNLGYRIDNFADYNKMPLTAYVKDKKQWIPLIERRKQLQRLIPQRIKNAKFIPVYDLNGLTTDGIHPTAEGHKIVAQVFLKSIKG